MRSFATSVFLLFIFSNAVAQKTYVFDRLLEYDFSKTDSDKSRKAYFLTNSKDNSYVLEAVERDSLKLTLYLTDQNGVRSVTYLDKKTFLAARTIELPCKYISRYKNPFKSQTENYEFSTGRDTTIGEKKYDVFTLKSKDRRREKRKKLGVAVYVLDRTYAEVLPLLPFSAAYEEWKLEKSIPNGIPKAMFLKSYGRKAKRSTIYSLVNVSEVTRSLVFPSECDYSKPQGQH